MSLLFSFPFIHSVSATNALSAAHCKSNRLNVNIGVIVGEHDTSRGDDSTYTSLLRIAHLLIHPKYNSITNANDIALVRFREPLKFNKGVQPACLPFKFMSESFVSRNVQAVGW
jgi:hypothetical protein